MLADGPSLPRLPRLPGAVLVALAALPVLAQAQDTTSLRRAVAAVPPGAPVQVEIRGTSRLVAPIVGTLADGFALRDTAGGARAVRYQDVSRFWVRRRAIGAGAIAGGVVGTGAGVFIGTLAAALCESSPCPSLPEGGLIGALVFGALGAGTGAVIGAAIPRWKLQWASPLPGARTGRRGAVVALPPPGENPQVERRRIGELAVFAVAGYGGFPPAGSSPDRGAMAGGMVDLAFRAGPIAFGPEFAVLLGEQRAFTLGGMARVNLAGERPGAAVPYLAAGLGGAFWRQPGFESSLLTATLGGGVTLGARWRVEARWQPVVQNTGAYLTGAGTPSRPTLFTVAAGHRFVW